MADFQALAVATWSKPGWVGLANAWSAFSFSNVTLQPKVPALAAHSVLIFVVIHWSSEAEKKSTGALIWPQSDSLAGGGP